MGAAATHLLVVDLPREDYTALKRLFVAFNEDDSWLSKHRRKAGFASLLRSSRVNISHDAAISELEFPVGQKDSLAEYFSAWGERLQSAMTDIAAVGGRACVVVNLMPFYLSRTRVDHIVRGLLLTKEGWYTNTLESLVFLTRNFDWFGKSVELINNFLPGIKDNALAIIDIRQYAGISNSGRLEVFSLPSRNDFRAILDVNKDSVYESLVFGTNVHLGHFVLKRSHVRTHYDLYNFIKRDAAWEFLVTILTSLVVNPSGLMVIGVGLEKNAIDLLVEHIRAHFDEHTSIAYEYVTSRNMANVTRELPGDYRSILVVTDILNTGETLRQVLKALRSAGIPRQSTAIFAMAKMANTVAEFDAGRTEIGVTIKRNYYEPASCPLCALLQPSTRVRLGDEFQHIHDFQLTPFDFWEIVTDAKALIKGGLDTQGRPFKYRVDTTRVIKRYEQWLTNVVRERCRRLSVSAKPSVVCTVDEPAGREFARLVAKCFSNIPVVAVSRSILDRITPSGDLPSDCLKLGFGPATQVILADDGINYGDTMRRLLQLCRHSHSIVLGGIVFVNRLGGERLSALQGQMMSNLLWLYDWAKESTKT